MGNATHFRAESASLKQQLEGFPSVAQWHLADRVIPIRALDHFRWLEDLNFRSYFLLVLDMDRVGWNKAAGHSVGGTHTRAPTRAHMWEQPEGGGRDQNALLIEQQSAEWGASEARAHSGSHHSGGR